MPAEPHAIPGFSFLMDLMREGHPANPALIETLIARFIEAAEKAVVDPMQVRLMRRRLAQLRGEMPVERVVEMGAAPPTTS
jgi:hypothetical protein